MLNLKKGRSPVLSVNLSNINDYKITINNTLWLKCGELTVWCDQEWYWVSHNTLIPQLSTPDEINGSALNLGSYKIISIKIQIFKIFDI